MIIIHQFPVYETAGNRLHVLVMIRDIDKHYQHCVHSSLSIQAVTQY